MDFKVYRCLIDPAMDSTLEVQFVALVDRPAIEKNFLAFKESEKKAHFFIDEDKQIICGPAMIAGLPIYRNDPDHGEYYVVFEKETVYAIVEKFAKKGFMNNVNLSHNLTDQPEDVTIFQSFISDSALGILPMKGFEDAPDGSWFIAMKVNNADIWSRVKAGEFKGFSIEGIFEQVPVKMQAQKITMEEAMKQIETILNQTLNTN